MTGPMRYRYEARHCKNFDLSSRTEWMLANGLGGYAMGTISGANTRRYHGHLVAATIPPAHRTVLLANVEASILGDANPIGISCNQYQGAVHPEGYQFIESFEAQSEFVRWHYKVAGLEITKELVVHPGENAVTLRYTNVGSRALELTLRPLVEHKFYHYNFRMTDDYPEDLAFPKDLTIVTHGGLSLYLNHPEAQRVPTFGWYYRFEYLRELERGLDPRDDLFCPCELRYELAPGSSAELVASLEPGLPPRPAPPDEPPGTDLGKSLADAAALFFVETPKRTSIIAGYPWFTDWGRDTMISIPGLCLCTGRVAQARRIILDYLGQMSQGLIPNRFVEGDEQPEYNTVDATLWCANAIYRTLVAEWDEEFARAAMDALEEIVHWHTKGTLYGIRVDPDDGLLTQGEEGVQLTWMDARVGDWVVTPRHGKPVEVNGLWVNALRIAEWLAERTGRGPVPYAEAAACAEQSFEAKFWKESLGYYLDTVDPDDGSLRPNQLIAMSLPFGPARGENARRALAIVTRELLTPEGVRTLSPNSPNYHGRYRGPLSELDAAYHQGTVWPWLLGPYVTALVALTGDRAEAKRILKAAKSMLPEYGVGGIAEVYDGDEPRSPGGCPWQAWSVAEILRAWTELHASRPRA